MSFQLDSPISKEFDNINSLLDYVDMEHKNTVRISVKGLVHEGACFEEDKGFGLGNEFYKFNEYSFNALCNLIGTTPAFLSSIEKPGLTSEILNDFFRSGKLSKNYQTLEVVCNTEQKQILGFVSDKYVGYSNKSLIDDVLQMLEGRQQKEFFPSLDKFDFQNAYVVNTRLNIRLSFEKKSGFIKGSGGKGDDYYKIGIEVFNSMAGGHALRLSYFIYRLICANGLIVPAADNQGSLVHSGKIENFRRRLWGNISKLSNSLGDMIKMIDLLAGLSFDPKRLAEYVEPKLIFRLVPDLDLKEACEDMLDHEKYIDIPKKQRNKLKLSDMIALIPTMIGKGHSLAVFDSDWRENASMWDFINLYTEYAKTLEPAKRVKVESKAGELANWIAVNKRKFS